MDDDASAELLRRLDAPTQASDRACAAVARGHRGTVTVLMVSAQRADVALPALADWLVASGCRDVRYRIPSPPDDIED